MVHGAAHMHVRMHDSLVVLGLGDGVAVQRELVELGQLLQLEHVLQVGDVVAVVV